MSMRQRITITRGAVASSGGPSAATTSTFGDWVVATMRLFPHAPRHHYFGTADANARPFAPAPTEILCAAYDGDPCMLPSLPTTANALMDDYLSEHPDSVVLKDPGGTLGMGGVLKLRDLVIDAFTATLTWPTRLVMYLPYISRADLDVAETLSRDMACDLVIVTAGTDTIHDEDTQCFGLRDGSPMVFDHDGNVIHAEEGYDDSE